MFKIQNGYLPESSYNSRVQEILDKFELRVLYYCDEKDILYNHQSYLNVLIKNQQSVPVYSMHDNIGEFNGIQDLERTGEFYIDEVISDKYNCDLKLEAVFYS